MALVSLEIQRLRNISQATLNFSSGFNLVYGANGSGKTSILEAIYFLSTARSFRNAQIGPIIQQGEEDCLVRGQVQHPNRQYRIGIQRDRRGGREIRINEESIKRGSDLVRLLPTLTLGPDSMELLLGPPLNRRRFLNWGVFHVEPQFGKLWEEATRALAQRNRLLRDGNPGAAELETWTDQLVSHATQVDRFRQSYVDRYRPVFDDVLSKITDLAGVSLHYDRGWDKTTELADVYRNQLSTDLKKGHTQNGFQRADVRIHVSGQPAARVCSRGELKAIVWSMVLTQGAVARQFEEQETLFLIDDLAAEFDANHRDRVCEYLQESGEQVVLTGIDRGVLQEATGGQFETMFHVEQGTVSPE